MSLLTHEVYGSEFSVDRTPKPFGFRTGQQRHSSLVHNGGWYNAAGERLGWGDLSHHDLRKISQEIPEGEAFYALYEADAFHKFVTEYGNIGAMCSVKPEISKPGIEYILKYARYRVTRGNLTIFRNNHDPFRGPTFVMQIYSDRKNEVVDTIEFNVERRPTKENDSHP